ncbi:MAG: hypothetical protein LUD81_06610, partial [Clostridiales bacterium]|nr:hypothetical protein [Clostridiales bacterium]
MKNKIICYGKLRGKVTDDFDKNLLNSILIIKTKHIKMLSELYYRFKGERPREGEAAGGEVSEGCLYPEFVKAALSELEDAETYRSLMGDFLNQSVR